MRITLPKDYRRYFTLADLDRAKAIINAEKENTMTAREWAEYAVKEAVGMDGWCVEILKVEAEASKNCRAWNMYSDESEDMDVWISFVAEIWHDGKPGFLKGGAYLSDIWGTGATKYRQHMYMNFFKACEE